MSPTYRRSSRPSPPGAGKRILLARSGHIHLVHFRSPAADSSLCHFDDKLPGPARSRPVLKCASDRLTECISDWFRVRTGGAHRCRLAQICCCALVYPRRWHRRAAGSASRQRWGRPTRAPTRRLDASIEVTDAYRQAAWTAPATVGAPRPPRPPLVTVRSGLWYTASVPKKESPYEHER